MMALNPKPLFLLYYIIIYMIIINFDRSLFLGYIRALCNFMSIILYNIYNNIRIICVQGFYSMYIVFKDIFIFRCVFGLTKRVCDFAQGFKYNIIRP